MYVTVERIIRVDSFVGAVRSSDTGHQNMACVTELPCCHVGITSRLHVSRNHGSVRAASKESTVFDSQTISATLDRCRGRGNAKLCTVYDALTSLSTAREY